MKKGKLLIAIGGLLLLVGLVLLGESEARGWWNGKDDYRLAVFSPEKIILVSISPQRGLVNELTVGEGINLWIPEGLGWYQTNRIDRLLTQEDKWGLAAKVAFYNYGFWPQQVVVTDQADNWDSWMLLAKNTGIINAIHLKLVLNSLLYRNDDISSDPDKDTTLDEWLVRDYADTNWLDNESKITIINASDDRGVADWLARRLTWMGLSVVDTESGEGQTDCRIRVANDQSPKPAVAFLKTVLNGCTEEASEQLNPDEVEVVVGKNWVKMLQYSSYVRTF